MSAKGSRLWLVAAALWTALSVFIWAGFLFGRSRDPLVLGYSGSFVLLLVALPVLLPLPIAGVWLARGMGWRRFFGEIGPTLALLAIVYLLAAGIYYQRQTHLFDPYTQSPGERIEDIDAPRTPGRLRVAALGGSTTAGPSLEPLERYPAQLQQRLLDAGHPADVFNGGQNWWTSRHSLTHYVTHVRHWHPDMVLVMHGINDLYRSFSPPDYAIGDYDPLYTHFYGASIQGARPPAFLESLFAQPIRLAGQQWYRPWRRREVDLPLSRFVSIEAFERNLRTLVHVVRADAAEPVLLTQPALFKPEPSADEIAVMRFGEEFCLTPTGRFTSEFPSPASLRRAMDAYNGVVKKIAADLDVPLVDLEAGVPRDLEHFIDDVHYTPKGAALVAQLAFAVVEKRLDERHR